MILYPAIDIRDGHAVRLIQGDYDRETAYDEDPVTAAVRWAKDGAEWLHVVDLDGALAGEPVNLPVVRRIVSAVDIPVQLGGGLRDSGKVEEAISAGVQRVILGTAALRDPDLIEAIASAHGDRIVASVDARAGKVAAEGWTEPSDLGPAELVRRLGDRGVGRFVFTPVERDGLMVGADADAVTEVAAAAHGELIYSGGIGTLEHLRELTALGIENLGGVIVGKALYEERFTVSEAREALR